MIEKIILTVVTVILWPITVFFIIKFFNRWEKQIDDLRGDFKDFCDRAPCMNHEMRISYLEGRGNGKNKSEART